MADKAGLFVVAVAHVGDIADVNHGTADTLDRQCAKFRDFLGAVVDAQDVVARTDLGRAGRQVHVLPVERVVDVLDRDAFPMHANRVGVDHDQTRPAAIRQRDCRTGYRHYFVTNEPQTLVVELLFAQRVAAQRDLQDWHAGCIVLHDLRRLLPWRHAPDDRLRRRGDLADRLVDPHGRLEVDADDVLAVDRVRLDPFDVVDGGSELLLREDRDLLFERIGRNAAVLPDQRYDRFRDLGKNILRHAKDGNDAEQDDQHRHNNECIGPAKRQPDDPQRVLPGL